MKIGGGGGPVTSFHTGASSPTRSRTLRPHIGTRDCCREHVTQRLLPPGGRPVRRRWTCGEGSGWDGGPG
jgi:hypothetical protein